MLHSSSLPSTPSDVVLPDTRGDTTPELEDTQFNGSSQHFADRFPEAKDLNEPDIQVNDLTVKKLRILMRENDMMVTGSKSTLTDRWQEYCEGTKLLHRCEKILPNLLTEVHADQKFYGELVKDLEISLELNHGSLECIKSRLQDTVIALVPKHQGDECSSPKCVAARKIAPKQGDRYFASFKWASKEENAVGPEERASLAAEIEQLRDFKRKLHTADNLKRQQAEAMLLRMREKMQENIEREGRKTMCRHKVDKAQSILARATTESDNAQTRGDKIHYHMKKVVALVNEFQKATHSAHRKAPK